MYASVWPRECSAFTRSFAMDFSSATLPNTSDEVGQAFAHAVPIPISRRSWQRMHLFTRPVRLLNAMTPNGHAPTQ